MNKTVLEASVQIKSYMLKLMLQVAHSCSTSYD